MSHLPVAIVCSVAIAWSWRAPGQDRQAFRARTDAVRLDVSVMEKRRPIANLPASAFVLTDNGVPQIVDVVHMNAIPIDVTVVVDVSSEAFTHRRMPEFVNELRKIADSLAPSDRLRVLADATYIGEVRPMTDARSGTAMTTMPFLDRPGGGSSTPDAVALALMALTPPDRRHLIVVFSQGLGSVAVLDYDRLPLVAAQSEAVLHVVSSRIYMGGYARGRQVLGPGAAALATAAELTGGSAHALGRGLADTLAAILRGFRQAYVVSYVPHRVEPAGWHAVSIRLNVPDADRYTVQVRRGYFFN